MAGPEARDMYLLASVLDVYVRGRGKIGGPPSVLTMLLLLVQLLQRMDLPRIYFSE